jgi:hypothetical protein
VFNDKRRAEGDFYAYYVDWLTVDKMHRKKGIAPQLIQTHEYNQRHLNKSISVSIFKRENHIMGIVPLTVYFAYFFDMDGVGVGVDKGTIEANLGKVIEIGKTNLQYFIDYMIINKNQFDICLIPDISVIMELIKTNNISIYAIVTNDEIQCLYFFKRSHVLLPQQKQKHTQKQLKDGEILILFESITNNKTNHQTNHQTNVFVQGFYEAMKKCIKKGSDHGINYQYLSIEDISHNNVILEKTNIRPFMKSPIGYYFYNYATSPFYSNKCFFIL